MKIWNLSYTVENYMLRLCFYHNLLCTRIMKFLKENSLYETCSS
jgi:hypothetical protein